jgi:hypothetical protein
LNVDAAGLGELAGTANDPRRVWTAHECKQWSRMSTDPPPSAGLYLSGTTGTTLWRMYYLFLRLLDGRCTDLQHHIRRAKVASNKQLSELSA